MDTRIAIVGAGISGLGAAYRLMTHGYQPVIFEKESFVGGRMSSEQVDGFIIDKGAYTFPHSHRTLRRFVEELGMGDALLPTPGTSATFSGGNAHRVKIGSPIDLLKYTLISGKGKKDLLSLFLYARFLGKALDIGRPTPKTFALETESAAEYLLEHYGEEILEKIAYPICCEIFLGVPERNSKLAFLATLKNLTNFRISAFTHGMGMVPERLAGSLEVRLNAPVLNIHPLSRKGPYEVRVGGAEPESRVFDAVVLALPAPLIPGIVDGLPPEWKRCFLDVVYAPSIVAAFGVEGHFGHTSMINNLLRTEFDVLGTVVFDRHKGRERVPLGRELVTAILCEKASRSLFDATDEKIVEETLKELDTLFPGLSGGLLFAKIHRWKYGAVQLPPHALSRRNPIRKAVKTGWQGLYFAGDGLDKSSLEVSFGTGVAAADRILLAGKG